MRTITLQLAVLASIVIARVCSAQFPATIYPEDLDGRAGFTVLGEKIDELGWTIAGVGDINGDGVDDFASGGPGHEPLFNCGWPFACPQDCDFTAGAVNVIFGRSDIGGDGLWNVADLDGTNGFRVPGIIPGDQAYNPSPAGDFNNDGIDDFIVGAPRARANGYWRAGEAYVIYGAPDVGAGGTFSPAQLDGTNGFTIKGAFGAAYVGESLASLDFNGDGIKDIAVGVPWSIVGEMVNAGQVYILYGGTGIGVSGAFTVPDMITPKNGLIINGILNGDHAGGTVSYGGDINGDGFDDLVTNSSYQPDGFAEGVAYVVYGGPDVECGGQFNLSDLNGINGFTIVGPSLDSADSAVVLSPRGVGDVNGDGYSDVALSISVPTPDGWLGVVFGGLGQARSGIFYLDSLDGTNGFRTRIGTPNPGGDVNSDGLAEIVSLATVLLGDQSIGFSGDVEIPSALDGMHGFRFFAGLLRVQNGIGDINDDGIDDLGIGRIYGNEENCQTRRCHMVFGRRMGDSDIDADVDLIDFGALQRCFRSETANTADDKPDVPDECHPFDFDKDNDIDLTDFAAFQTALGTPP